MTAKAARARLDAALKVVQDVLDEEVENVVKLGHGVLDEAQWKAAVAASWALRSASTR